MCIRDREVHRHQHHFPEEEEQEHVDGKEHADNAAQDPHQVEVEEASCCPSSMANSGFSFFFGVGALGV